MKSALYLAYKVATRFLAPLSLRKTGLPLLHVKGDPSSTVRRIVFDFSHRTTHLGDRLFFLPLIVQLKAAGFTIALKEADRLTEPLFNAIVSEPLGLEREAGGGGDLVVIPFPAWLADHGRHPRMLAVDFTDTACDQVLGRQLVVSMNKVLGMHLNDEATLPVVSPRTCFALPEDAGSRYFLFSNYIESGGFRRRFVDEGLLAQKAQDLRRQGFRLVHVGSAADRQRDKRRYDFIDLDLRGLTQVADLPALMNDPRVAGAVGFDNVLMHLAGIFGKRAYVLFRGRWGRAAYEHHMARVNNTFFASAAGIDYLRE